MKTLTVSIAITIAILGTACDLYPWEKDSRGETGEEEPAWLDCWDHSRDGQRFDTYDLCWEPSPLIDAALHLAGEEKTSPAICNDEWATFDWVADNWVGSTVTIHVCGQWPSESREAHDGVGFAIKEVGSVRYLPSYWPTEDMATLGGSFQYCELGVVCSGWLSSPCFCRCESDSDCSGSGEMYCLNGESGMGEDNVPVCAYDGEVPDQAPVEL